MDLLNTVTELSHEFGTGDYIQAGGGNTSVKDAETLWIKPSGTTLGGLRPELFVALSRAKLRELYDVTPPEETVAREALVKDLMMASVLSDSKGRPSVEAPLHESFDATFVVHTHPAVVNGMTCAGEGAATSRRLFPDALWIEFIDPGFTVCMKVREELHAYAARHGRQPQVVLLENHGVFVAGDTPETIRASYRHLMETLTACYRDAGIDLELAVGPAPAADTVKAVAARIRESFGEEDGAHVCAGGAFPVPDGPLTPDHIVYHKAYPLKADPTPEAVAAFRAKNGYSPRIVVCEEGIFGVGTTAKNASLALELALDGALVAQFAAAFGGVQFMSEQARDFIDNWEVEAYRRKLASTEEKR